MAIIHRRLTEKFTPISNEILADKRLSWKARGILAYMLSMKEDWQFYTTELATHSDKDGVKALRSGLKELEELGYLRRLQPKKKDGHFDSFEWLLTDTPAFSPDAQNRHAVKRQTANGHAVKGTLTKTNLNKDLNEQRLIENNMSGAPSPFHSADAERIPYKQIIDYLNKKAGTHYKPTSKATQKLIKARWHEGFTFEDFKKVIDNQAFSWQGTEWWAYMRPSTLFNASKFEGYLNANNPKKIDRMPKTGGYEVLDRGNTPNYKNSGPF